MTAASSPPGPVRRLAFGILFAAGTFGVGALGTTLALQGTGRAAEAAPAAVFYANCGSLLAAGAGPIAMGEPGYRAALDSDHDGVACEFDSE